MLRNCVGSLAVFHKRKTSAMGTTELNRVKFTLHLAALAEPAGGRPFSASAAQTLLPSAAFSPCSPLIVQAKVRLRLTFLLRTFVSGCAVGSSPALETNVTNFIAGTKVLVKRDS